MKLCDITLLTHTIEKPYAVQALIYVAALEVENTALLSTVLEIQQSIKNVLAHLLLCFYKYLIALFGF